MKLFSLLLVILLGLVVVAQADACGGGAGRQRRHGLLYRLRHRHQAEETVTEYRETWYSSGCVAPGVGYAAPEPERVEPIRKPPQSTLPAVK